MKNKATQTIVFAALLLTLAVVLKIFGIPVSLFGGLAKDINLSPVIILYSGMVLGPVSVSYTHLDVYKRQRQKIQSLCCMLVHAQKQRQNGNQDDSAAHAHAADNAKNKSRNCKPNHIKTPSVFPKR